MPRIYYKEQKIYGRQIETDVINLKNVNFLMRCPKPQQTLELAADENGGYNDWFRYIQVSNDGINYNDSQYGSMYLPSAIIFYDDKDHIFPSLFYFISIDLFDKSCVA